eukprot:scaffold6413_cov121-Isochrysis_galbana.AAC.10
MRTAVAAPQPAPGATRRVRLRMGSEKGAVMQGPGAGMEKRKVQCLHSTLSACTGGRRPSLARATAECRSSEKHARRGG